MEQLIIGRIRAWVIENLVWPKVRIVKLPSIGSQKEKEAGLEKETETEKEDYVIVDEVGRSTDNGDAASPEMDSSAIDDDDEQEDNDGRLETKLHIDFTDRQSSSINSQNVTLQAITSAIGDKVQSRSSRRDSRRHSTASSNVPSSTGTSTPSTATAASPPELSSDSSSSHAFKEVHRQRSLRHRTPLNSPGLGIGFGSKSLHSQQAYERRGPLHRSSSSLSERINAGAGFFDVEDPRWEVAKKAARDRRSLSPVQDVSLNDDL